ncbi:MAG: hypothetical protein IJJ72_11530 [Bacteroidales bacterium]|nr:hypothetical protein [Oscillospiraceae bacterium]MBR0501608.1 hypothetical protein [Bacteroidales bacterium]
MEKKEKQFYEAPSVEFFEVKQEGVICASGKTEQFRNGDSYDDDDFI